MGLGGKCLVGSTAGIDDSQSPQPSLGGWLITSRIKGRWENASIPQLMDVKGLNIGLNGVVCGRAVMPPSYDLILVQKGRLQIKTVEVSNREEAWRLGRETYSNGLRGVVCHERTAAPPADSS